MNALGAVLLWTFAQALVLLAPAAVVYSIARRLGPSPAATVAFIGVALPLLLVVLAFTPWPLWVRFMPNRPATRPSTDTPARDSGPDSTALIDRTGQTTSLLGLATSSTGESPSEGQGIPAALVTLLSRVVECVQAAAATEGRWTWLGWIGLVLTAGASANICRLMYGLYVVREYRRASVPIKDQGLIEQLEILCAELSVVSRLELRESRCVAPAAVMGWRRPVILLASDWRGWSDEQRTAILAHEIAHIRRHDYRVCLCAQFALALQFFQPLSRWMNSRLEMQQERAADALACSVAGIGGQQRYCAVLLGLLNQITAGPMPRAARAFLPTCGNLAARLETLKYVPLSTKLPPVRVGWALGCMLLVAAMTIAGIRSPIAFGRVANVLQPLHDDHGIEPSVREDEISQRQAVQSATLTSSDAPLKGAASGKSAILDDHPNSVGPEGGHEYLLSPNGTLLIRGSLETDYDRDAFRVRLQQPGPVHVTLIPSAIGSRAALRVSWSVPELAQTDSDQDFGSGRGGRMFINIPHVPPDPDNWVHIDVTSAPDENGGKPLGDYILFVRQPLMNGDIDPENLGVAASPIVLDPLGNGYLSPKLSTRRHAPRLDYPADVDVFVATVPRTGLYTFTVRFAGDGKQSALSPRLEVYDASETAADRVLRPGLDDRSSFSVEAKSGSSYYLKVSAVDETALGEYTVQVMLSDAP